MFSLSIKSFKKINNRFNDLSMSLNDFINSIYIKIQKKDAAKWIWKKKLMNAGSLKQKTSLIRR